MWIVNANLVPRDGNVSMDVTSLYTNIPQEQGIEAVCIAYETYYKGESPIPTQYLKRALENSFQFIGKNYLQTHGTAMGTKMAAFCQHLYGKGRNTNPKSKCS